MAFDPVESWLHRSSGHRWIVAHGHIRGMDQKENQTSKVSLLQKGIFTEVKIPFPVRCLQRRNLTEDYHV